MQFCEYVLGSSNMSIDTSGNITVNAQTDADWGVIIYPAQCQDLSEGNPYACQAPNLPGPSASVYSVVYPGGASSSGSGTGGAQLTPVLTAQANQAGTYTETSYHSASFDNGEGYNTINLQTQQSQSYAPAPTITSISPNPWQAGWQNQTVTIVGTGFGTSPSVSVTGDGDVSWSQGDSTPTQISGTVTISASDPGTNPPSVSVTANGSGNGLLGQQGAPIKVSQTIPVIPAPPADSFSVTYQSAILTADHVTGGAFCFYSVSPNPNPVFYVYMGDSNRNTYRTNESITITPDNSVSSNSSVATGQTRQYAYGSPANGSTLSSLDEDNVWHDCHLFNDAGNAPTSGMSNSVSYPGFYQANYIASGSATNPLDVQFGAISWSLTVALDDTNAQNPTASVTGSHTCYPSHNVTVNGQSIYSYAPGNDSFSYIAACLLGVLPNKQVSVSPVVVPK